MVRLFKRHTARVNYFLDGMWKFKTDPCQKGFLERWYEKLPGNCMETIVPSCWNNDLGLYDYEGLAWYFTEFTTSSPNINLIFHAVTGEAKVYLDGLFIGNHYGGWTGFHFELYNLNPGNHTLAVAVDNTHNQEDTLPLSMVDWYHYGGIPRSVEVQELADTWIKSCRVDYSLSDNLKHADLVFDINVSFLTGSSLERDLNIYFDDKKLITYHINHDSPSLNIKLDNCGVENIRLWDILQPNLYYIRLELSENGRIIDDIIDRIGFRQIKIQDKKLLLNGKEVYLKGVNRHEDHPDWGFAFPLKLMKKDIDIIKNMGCNSVRGSHYPNSELFLDYLDQEGLLFYEEIPMWQYFDKHFKNPVVVNRGLSMLEEMVTRDFHHPSIIIWGVHNEVDTKIESCYAMTKTFVDKVRSLDSSRLVTYATMQPFEDICFPLVDLISINKYYGWYLGEIEDWNKFLSDFKEWLKKAQLQHLPVVISEFGAASLYGDSTFEQPKWTENYQEKLLDYTLQLFLNDPDIAGSFIWQFADMRTSKEAAMGRARSFNNKGIVNEYRKPKMAYWTVRKIYNEIK